MAEILPENINVMLEISIPSHRENDYDGYYYILSVQGSNFDMEDSAFLNGDDTVVEEGNDNIFFSDDWKLYHWTPIGDDNYVPGPPMNYY